MGTRLPVLVAVLVLAGASAACGIGRRVTAGDGDAGSGGQVGVTLTLQRCPRIGSISISPDEMDLGSPYPILLETTAEVAGGGTPSYSWSAPSGHFGDASAPVTTFDCTAAGVVTVECTATNDGCHDAMSASLMCGPADGGS